MLYFLLLFGAVVFNTGSGVLYKTSSLSSNRNMAVALLSLGLLLGAVNAVLYTKSLKGLRLNVAYPIFSTASIVLLSVLSVPFFGENMTNRNALGILVVCVGIFLLVG
jgi:multidrug transporter EmrE-like cation transporter